MNLTHDPRNSTLVFGTHIVQGFAEGRNIAFDALPDAFTNVVDVHGRNLRIYSSNKNTTLRITLHPSSDSNGVLSEFLQADRLGGNGSFNLLFRDATGNTEIKSDGAYVMNPPSYEDGNEFSNREWVIQLVDCTYIIGAVGV